MKRNMKEVRAMTEPCAYCREVIDEKHPGDYYPRYRCWLHHECAKFLKQEEEEWLRTAPQWLREAYLRYVSEMEAMDR